VCVCVCAALDLQIWGPVDVGLAHWPLHLFSLTFAVYQCPSVGVLQNIVAL